MAFIERQANHDIIAIAFAVAQPAGIFPDQRQAQRPARRPRGDAKQRRLAGIKTQFKPRRIDRHRIDHIARAWRLAHHRLDLACQLFEYIQIGADDLDENRRIDRRAVLENLHDELRLGIGGKARAQPVDKRRAARRIPSLEHHQHFAEITALVETALVIKYLRITAPDIGEHIQDIGFALGGIFDKSDGAIGARQCRAFGRRDRDEEV